MNYDEVMHFIESYTKTGTHITDLARFRRLMNELGNPQEMLKFIHVAGTNGKGSTVRMLSGIFHTAGYCTGEFTSPFIYRYNDRISVDGSEISDDELCAAAEEVIPVVKQTSELGYSQFEITCAIAFVHFLKRNCEIVILETGIGGRLDCTNIIPPPICSVITSISYDHTAVLGNTLSEIARNKAGIIKYGSPCILQCGNSGEAAAVIIDEAEKCGSKVIVPKASSIRIQKSDYTGNEFTYGLKKLRTSMPGKHQIYNAVTAYEAALCAKKYGYDLSFGEIYNGIYKANLPSRCQVIQIDSPMIIMDGAHNPDGMKKLAEFISEIKLSPKVMICGMLETKDWQTALGSIAPLIDKAYCVDGFAKGAVFAPKLAEMFRHGEAASISEAYYKSAVYAGKSGLVVIGGSLYLASALHKYSKL